MNDFFCAECSAKLDALLGALGGAKSGATPELAQVVAFASKDQATATASPRTRHEYKDPYFLRFWDEYPRRIAKAPALKAWHRAVRRGAHPEAIIDATKVYAAAHRRKQTDPQYIPYPAKWLNDERYNDEPEQMLVADLGPAIGSEEWQAQQDAEFERIKQEFA